MRSFKIGRRKAVTGITALGAALAMLVTGGVSYQLVTSTDAALSDILTFGGIYQAEPEEIKPSGQWSYSMVSLDVAPGTKGTSHSPQPYRHELQREYSEQAQSRQSSGGACVWGGAGASCGNTPSAEAASDATAAGDILSSSWDPGGTAAAAYFRPSSPLTTGVRCTAQGDSSDLRATAPTGVIQYGNSSYWWFPGGFHDFNVGTQASGASVRHQVARGTDTHTEVSMTKSHGTDRSQHRAWSEVVLTVRGEHSGGYSDTLTYTFRSECGISFNDGSGSKGPRGVTTGAGRFTNFLRTFVPWLDDDDEEELSDDEDSTTTSAADESTSRDAGDRESTSRNTDDEEATTSSESEESSSRRSGDRTTTSTSRPAGDRGDDESESASPGRDATSGERTETRTERTREPEPATSATSEAPEATSTRPAEPEAAEPLPTTAPGSPRSSGFSDESTLNLNGTAYHVLSTRTLASADVQTLANVEAAAVAAAADHVFTGTTSGASWSYFSGSGIDVIEVQLPDGSIAQLRLASHGAALPQPDVVAPTQDDVAPAQDDVTPAQDDEE